MVVTFFLSDAIRDPIYTNHRCRLCELVKITTSDIDHIIEAQ